MVGEDWQCESESGSASESVGRLKLEGAFERTSFRHPVLHPFQQSSSELWEDDVAEEDDQEEQVMEERWRDVWAHRKQRQRFGSSGGGGGGGGSLGPRHQHWRSQPQPGQQQHQAGRDVPALQVYVEAMDPALRANAARIAGVETSAVLEAGAYPRPISAQLEPFCPPCNPD
jgi:hypothetical protein